MRDRLIGLLLAAVVASLLVSPVNASDADSLGLLVKALETNKGAAVRVSLMKGMLSGLEGRRDVKAPAGWAALSEKLMNNKDANVARLARQLGQMFGDTGATEKALELVLDDGGNLAARQAALKGLLGQGSLSVPELGAVLEGLLGEKAMRLDAIRGYGVVEVNGAVKVLLGGYKGYDAAEKRAAVESLASRQIYANGLVGALKTGRVAKGDVPSYVARSLSGMLGKTFTDVYGVAREVSADKSKMIAEYKKKLSPAVIAKANAQRGRAVYERTCGACHVMYGAGGLIGPELTGSNRRDLDYLLLNMVDPNDDVPDAYKMVMITTKDGRVLAGNVGVEDANRVVLRMVGQESVVAKSDIAKRDVSAFSLMPEGQLLTLKDGEVADLVKYLRTDNQVELAK